MYMGNRIMTQIERIGTYRLILDTGRHLDQEKYLPVLDCARNLIFIRKLDDLYFNFKIGNSIFSLYK